MKHPFLVLLYTLLLWASSHQAAAQVTEYFTDTDLPNPAVWQGDLDQFVVQDDSLRLQAAGAGTYYLSTPSQAIDSASWELEVFLSFNPSSANYTAFYLSSDQPVLTDSLQGYYVKVGGSSDEVSLYRQDGTRHVELIDGLDKLVSTNPVQVGIRVFRDLEGTWQLWADSALTGNWQLMGEISDQTYLTSRYAGVAATVTSSRRDKVWFDQLTISGQAYRDRDAPQLRSWQLQNTATLQLYFNESLSPTQASTRLRLEPGAGELALQVTDQQLELSWTEGFQSGQNYMLLLSGVSDTSGNLSEADTVRFFYFRQPELRAGMVVINELLPDPSPSAGLPAGEMIELYNTTNQYLSLAGWFLRDGSSTRQLPQAYLPPAGYRILCPAADSTAWAAYGPVLPLANWPSLNNSGDQLALYAADSLLLDSLAYQTDWYRDETRASGGYTLERINPYTDCNGWTNWRASAASHGGTPAQQNSHYDPSPDTLAPQLEQLTLLSPDSLLLYFNEPLAIAGASNLLSATLNEAAVQQIEQDSLRPAQILLVLPSLMPSEQVQQLQWLGATDCAGNQAPTDSTRFYVDYTGPRLSDWRVRSDRELLLTFHEPLQQSTSEREATYQLNGMRPNRAKLQDRQEVLLVFDSAFAERRYSLSWAGLSDTLGNTVVADSLSWQYQNELTGVQVLAPNVLELRFSRVPTLNTDSLAQHLALADNPALSWIASSDSLSYLIGFAQPFDQNKVLRLYIQGLRTTAGELMMTPAADFVYDTRAPRLASWSWHAADSLILHFDEPLDPVQAHIVNHYALQDTALQYPEEVQLLADSAVLLRYASVAHEQDYTLRISGLADRYGNTLSQTLRALLRFDLMAPVVERVQVEQATRLRLVLHEPIKIDSTSACWLEGLPAVQLSTSPYLPAELVMQLEEPIARERGLLLQCTGIADVVGNQADTLGATVDHAKTQLVAAAFYTDSVVELVWSAPLADAGQWFTDKEGPEVIHTQLHADSTTLWLGLSSRWAGEDLSLQGQGVVDRQGEALPALTSLLHYQAPIDTLVIEGDQLLAVYFDRPLAADYWSVPGTFQLDGLPVGTVLPSEETAGGLRLVLEAPLLPNQPYVLHWAPGYFADGSRLAGGRYLLRWDQEAPRLRHAELCSDHLLALRFSEPMRPGTLAAYNHYRLVGHSVEWIEVLTPDSLVMAFSPRLRDGGILQLELSGQQDHWSNQLADTSLELQYEARYLAQAGELLINEFMPVPAEDGDLWPVEYVELYNRSGQLLELEGYRLADARSSVPLPDYQLPAGAHLVLYQSQSNLVLTDTIAALALSTWPTLNNSGDALAIYSPAGLLLDSISYSSSWYGGVDPTGRSLERINPLVNPCVERLNWAPASVVRGGSPGLQNSVFDTLPDQEAPELLDLSWLSRDSLHLRFSEPMNITLPGEMRLAGEAQDLLLSQWQAAQRDELLLVLASPLPAGTLIELTLAGFEDCAGNAVPALKTSTGWGRAPKLHELVITEVMAIPDEENEQLPAAEYIELRNVSDALLSLAAVGLADNRDTVWLSEAVLPFGESLILCPAVFERDFHAYGRVLGLSSWPGLNNDGETLRLLDRSGVELHRVAYEPAWYSGADPSGLALEMVDQSQPCREQMNWEPSTDPRGGTPGTANAVAMPRPDLNGPRIKEVTLQDTLVTLYFDEPLDHRRFSQLEVSMDPVQEIAWQEEQLYFPQRLRFLLGRALEPDRVYELALAGVRDCAGNPLTSEAGRAELLVPVSPDSGDVLLSELLFNPRPGSVDFVELYNTSEHYLDLSGWSLQAEPVAATASLAAPGSLVLAPYSFYVLTASTSALQEEFPRVPIGQVLEVEMPAMPDAAGSVWLVHTDGRLLDGLHYQEGQHHPLLADREGVSLERLSYEVPATQPQNWASASRESDFATPGRVNSQQLHEGTGAALSVSPEVLLPGHPGGADFCTITYRLEQNNWLGNFLIYQPNGQLVRELASNALLASEGFYTWDGADDIGNPVAMGYYILQVELWNLAGQKKLLRKTIAVSSK